jgi:hypothetical protein
MVNKIVVLLLRMYSHRYLKTHDEGLSYINTINAIAQSIAPLVDYPLKFEICGILILDTPRFSSA